MADVPAEATAGGPPDGRAPGRFDQVLELLLSRLRESMRADIGAVLLEQDGVLRVAAALGVSPELLSAAEERVGQGFAGTIAATSAPGAISDTSRGDAGGVPWAAEGVPAPVGGPPGRGGGGPR